MHESYIVHDVSLTTDDGGDSEVSTKSRTNVGDLAPEVPTDRERYSLDRAV
jgi:hypothetical protein